MIIVRPLVEHIEELFDGARIPSVDALRPSSCPRCGTLAFPPGERFGIVGHGTYRRQVLGTVEVTGETVTWVRRYLCRGCNGSINILSDHLHPRRWYAAGVILEVLRLHLFEGWSEREIRERFGVVIDSESWRTPRRWRSELLVTLWCWLSRRLGFRKKIATRSDGGHRLRRLFSQATTEKKPESTTVARILLRSTVHFQGVTWPLGRDPPENLKAEIPL